MNEQIKFWRDPRYINMELLHARFVTHRFSRHTHETFAIGVIQQGAEGFFYRGKEFVAPAGHVVVINPGEPHTGHAATEAGWMYRMLYPDVSILQRASVEVWGREEVPYFLEPVIDDRVLAQMLLNLHTTLEGHSRLEQDSRLLWTMTQLVTRYADRHGTIQPVGCESLPIQRVREYLEAHYGENLSLEDLSAIANLSPFYLLRTFRKQVGLPPHEYLNQVRLIRAKEFLAQGKAIADVAHFTGFADQSHFTRQFKRMVGVTPGQYQGGSLCLSQA